MTNSYRKACTEVLEIISYFTDEEYSKIPNKKIEFLKANIDTNYQYKINPNLDLSQQEISKEANAILITIFRDYFATNKQKEILKRLLNQNQQKLEQKKFKKYNSNELYKNLSNNKVNIDETQENSLVKVKEKSFFKLINFIKNIFKR